MINVVLCGYCGERLNDGPEAFAAHDATCEHNPLVKRVAELESELRIAWEDDPAMKELQLEAAVLKDNLSMARKVIDNLKAQLAWTPVAQGLPTEPGLYLFVCRGEEKLYTVSDGKFLQHTENGTDPWDASPMHYWSYYRRITLPEAT